MTDDPIEHLTHQLEQLQPRRVLVAADHVPAVINEWARQHGAELTTVSSARDDWQELGRYEFTVVIDYLEHLDKPEALQKLARLRNLHSQRIWVLVDRDSTWRFGDFIGLGFHRYAQFAGDVQSGASVCYGYDLASYNHIRSWNNPRFWANPENWNKYRW
ncbi:DUF6231 family protein [Gilvimarinus sp. F26214L]|uniref:DUF6231 family protein n=1 Tax=Gilvimarinus sp. DZF01 TaxID=3461371 RepID=UPI004045221D